MKDFLGNELKAGDPVVVVTPSWRSHGLRLGVIKKITPKRATVSYQEPGYEIDPVLSVETHRIMKMPL